jgi:uncharacterized protein (DUF2336 family)
MEPSRSIIAELETAIAGGSYENRVATLRRVTDLFLLRADDYSEPQVDVFDQVISRIADRLEAKARAELAVRLAPINNAPTNVVRSLARDETFEVAAPVLRHSNRLTDQDLLAVASGNSQERLLAISKRRTLSSAVGDVLVTRGNQEVVRSVARNEGARFSNAGYDRLVARSLHDEELAVSVGLRADISKEHFQSLVTKASEAVFKRLAASNPTAVAEVKRVISDLTGNTAVGGTKAARDYERAKERFDAGRSSGSSIDSVVHGFAKAGDFEATVVALAGLCQIPVETVEQILTDKRADTDIVLLLAKASHLSWSTTRLILQMHKSEGGLSAQDIETANLHFDRLQSSTAQRVVRFYHVRRAAGAAADSPSIPA